MLNWVSTLTKYLNKFLELGVLLLAVSVIAEIVFGPNVAFFGSQVTKNLINFYECRILLNTYICPKPLVNLIDASGSHK